MTDIKDFDIRYTKPEDEQYLKNWLSKEEEWKCFPFSSHEEKETMIKNWIGFYRYRSSLTADINGVPCAIGTLFLMPFKKVAHHCLLYLIVEKTHRRKKIGTSMLKNLLHLSKKYFSHEFVHVEVYEGCAILPLLEKFQFKVFAKQEGFVREKDNTFLSKILLRHDF